MKVDVSSSHSFVVRKDEMTRMEMAAIRTLQTETSFSSRLAAEIGVI